MNANERDWVYQTDTGPVLFPDLTREPSDLLAGMELAYVALNSPDWADFIVRTRTRLAADIEVYHYSKPIRHRTASQRDLHHPSRRVRRPTATRPAAGRDGRAWGMSSADTQHSASPDSPSSDGHRAPGTMTGADALAEVLKREGVDKVFFFPASPIAEAIARPESG